ncbi:hypothetical protein DERP_011101 [Dermatophagoides pteronyssinus]|uniref:Uncharacterized protein n=1 Tax=Dermatophagoides pteronyssinus TaxID=6956 RepID=A0ABQ8J9G8_DERPT|nr:hypothetical protein DERP_011101 [Dermatophagoides pteronyssinus]
MKKRNTGNVYRLKKRLHFCCANNVLHATPDSANAVAIFSCELTNSRIFVSKLKINVGIACTLLLRAVSGHSSTSTFKNFKPRAEYSCDKRSNTGAIR